MNTTKLIKKEVSLHSNDGKLLKGWLYTADTKFSCSKATEDKLIKRDEYIEDITQKLCELGYSVFLHDRSLTEEINKDEVEYSGPYYW